MNTPDWLPAGTRVYDREGQDSGTTTGGARPCRMDGCSGIRVRVKWPDGQITWNCTRGLVKRKDGHWQLA